MLEVNTKPITKVQVLVWLVWGLLAAVVLASICYGGWNYLATYKLGEQEPSPLATAIFLTPQQIEALHSIGLGVFEFRAYLVTVALLVAIIYWVVAVGIFLSKPTSSVVWLTSVMMLTYIPTEVELLQEGIRAPFLNNQSTWAWWYGEILQAVGEALTLLIFLIFPSGRFTSRTGGVFGIAYTLFVALCLIPNMPFNVLNGEVFDQYAPYSTIFVIVVHACGVATLIHRYAKLRRSDKSQWAATYLVAYALIAAFAVSASRYALQALLEGSSWLLQPNVQVIYKMTLRPLQWVLLLVVPVAIAVNQLRRNLKDARQQSRNIELKGVMIVEHREQLLDEISRDIHDSVISDIAAGVLQLDRVPLQPDEEVAASRLHEAQNNLREIISQLREMTYKWSPPILEKYDLIEVLQIELKALSHPEHEEISNIRKPAFALDAPSSLPPISLATRKAAYLIVKESLNNVIKYANASTCQIIVRVVVEAPGNKASLQPELRWLYIFIEDDGIGMPGKSAHTGKGLSSMRRRAEELGGKIKITSRPGIGTKIEAWFPLRVLGKENYEYGPETNGLDS
jgi:signal transduction histidine kinase